MITVGGEGGMRDPVGGRIGQLVVNVKAGSGVVGSSRDADQIFPVTAPLKIVVARRVRPIAAAERRDSEAVAQCAVDHDARDLVAPNRADNEGVVRAVVRKVEGVAVGGKPSG
jgi:hypothetical protein